MSFDLGVFFISRNEVDVDVRSVTISKEKAGKKRMYMTVGALVEGKVFLAQFC